MTDLINQLKKIGVPDPSFEARYILSYTQDPDKIKEVLQRRRTSEPLAKIFEDKGFYAHTFITTRDTLDPRPDSEGFMESLIHLVPQNAAFTIADIGTGTGCLLFSVLMHYPKAYGLGYDISTRALRVAKRNQEKFNLQGRSELVLQDCFKENATYRRKFDIVLSNPPYLTEEEYEKLDPQTRHDPKISLTISPDGLHAYRMLAKQTDYLKPTGLLMMEVGSTQAEEVIKLFPHLKLLGIQKDLGGHQRILTFQK